jgi:hypothetical protein
MIENTNTLLCHPHETLMNNNPETMESNPVFTRVSLRPNPFNTTLTLEIASVMNQQVVVKLTSPAGGIVSLFGWYLLKGTNVTTIKDMGKIAAGKYTLFILTNEGESLHRAMVEKA